MTYAEARAILTDCQHSPTNDVHLGGPDHRIIRVCNECWNRHVAARRQARREQLSQHHDRLRGLLLPMMQRMGVNYGARVDCFFHSMLGLGGILLTGTVVKRRDLPYVRLDRPFDGRRDVLWNKRWEVVNTKALT